MLYQLRQMLSTHKDLKKKNGAMAGANQGRQSGIPVSNIL